MMKLAFEHCSPSMKQNRNKEKVKSVLELENNNFIYKNRGQENIVTFSLPTCQLGV